VVDTNLTLVEDEEGYFSLERGQEIQNKLRHYPFIEEKDKVAGRIFDAQKARKRKEQTRVKKFRLLIYSSRSCLFLSPWRNFSQWDFLRRSLLTGLHVRSWRTRKMRRKKT